MTTGMVVTIVNVIVIILFGLFMFYVLSAMYPKKKIEAEIERKFLLKPDFDIALVPGLVFLEESDMEQFYAEVTPEMEQRFRMTSFRETGKVTYEAEIKHGVGMQRQCVKTSVSEREYLTEKKVITGIKPISKYRRDYLIEGTELILELCVIDGELNVIEIEFDTEKQALEFQPFFEIEREVTNEKEFKMKNYWTATRSLNVTTV